MTAERATRLVLGWTRVYTALVPPEARAVRRAEVESDLWESLADRAGARDILPRLMLGVFDDLAWSLEHMDTTTRASAWWSFGSLFSVIVCWVWVVYAPGSAAMRESLWAYPIVLTLHLMGLIVLVAAQGALSARLTGRALTDVPMATVAGHAAPWTAIGAVVSIVSGLALCAAEPAEFATNVTFRLKLVALALVLVNVWFTHGVALRRVHEWDRAPHPPAIARASGYIAIALWLVVILAGRLTAFNPWR
jgi:hypothetical protein